MNSKTMILQSQTSNKSGRAILTLTKENDLLKTKLRLYSFSALNTNCKLGVFHNNQVYSSNMLFKDGAYISSLVGDFDMDNDFYCAIVDTQNNNEPLLAGGTYGGFYFNDTSVITKNLNNSFSPNKIMPDACETAFSNPQPLHASEQPCFNTCSNDSTNANPCANCKYKEYFYTQNPVANTQTPNISKSAHTSQPVAENSQTIANQSTQQCQEEDDDKSQTTAPAPNTKTAPSIVESLIPQFDYIFKTYPACEQLNSAIENSRFVTITEGSSTYCLGAIYKDDQLQYICYAVPTAYNAPVPQELGEHHQWLPLDPTDPLSDGYHIVFQDAHDLKIVEF